MCDVSTPADEPDPFRAQTPAEFVDALNHLRVWAGQPAYRQISRLAAQRPDGRPAAEPLSPSTVQEVLAGKRLPRLPKLTFTESFVTACMRSRGATDQQAEAAVDRWRAAWRALATDEAPPPPPVDSDRPPARRKRPLVAALVLVAVFVAGAAAGSVGTWLATRDDVPATSAAGPDRQQTGECGPAVDRPAGPDILTRPATENWWTNDRRIGLAVKDRAAWDAAVDSGSQNPWDLLVVRGSVQVQIGHRYALVVTVSASASLVIRVRVQDNEAPEYKASLHEDVSVGPQECHRTFTFVGAKTSGTSEVTFQLGGHDAFRIAAKDLALIDVGPAG